MENLRWILIIVGVAILALLYFSGRAESRAASGKSRLSNRADGNDDFDVLLDGSAEPPVDGFNEVDLEDFVRPGMPLDIPGSNNSNSYGASAVSADNLALDEYDFEAETGRSRSSTPGFTSFAQKIESISERLSPKRRQRIAESQPADAGELPAEDSATVNKIVTLHIVAPPNSLMNGEQLLDVFDRRGYHFGDMNIFHSMHNGETVFSVAKMIEPGIFDIDDVESFATPGITLILQLPGPVTADVAFEVLISESFEIANELGASVLDGDRNTLSKQTLQHMREGIYEHMHRQKYFGSVPS